MHSKRVWEILNRSLALPRAVVVAAMIALSAVPVVTIGSIAYVSAQRTLTHQIVEDNFEQTRAVRQNIALFLDQDLNEMEFAAAALPSKRGGAAAALYLDQFRTAFPLFSSVALWDGAGRLIVHSGAQPAFGSRLSSTLMTATAAVSWNGARMTTGEILLNLVVPIAAASGGVEGWLSGDL